MQGNKQRDKEEMKFLGGQVILLVTFALNVLSTLAIILIIFRLGITDKTRVLKLDLDSNEISINQNVLSDSLLLSSGDLRTRLIEAEQVSLDGSASHLGDSSAQISMRSDSISMRAKSFSASEVGTEMGLAFTIPKGLNVLEVPDGINNLHSIRSPVTTRKDQSQGKNTDLDLSSSGMLELSGNLGLSVLSKDIDIESQNFISLTSNKESITVSAGNGIYLPSIMSINQYSREHSARPEAESERYWLCMNAEGMLYKSIESC